MNVTLGMHVLFHNEERKYRNTGDITTDKDLVWFSYKKPLCLLDSSEVKRKADKIDSRLSKQEIKHTASIFL